MKFDIQPYYGDKKCKGFYVWNKPTFFVNKDDKRYDSMIQEKGKLVCLVMKHGI